MGRIALSDQWTELLRIATAAQPLWNQRRSPSHEEAEALREFNEKATPQTIGDLLTENERLKRIEACHDMIASELQDAADACERFKVCRD